MVQRIAARGRTISEAGNLGGEGPLAQHRNGESLRLGGEHLQLLDAGPHSNAAEHGACGATVTGAGVLGSPIVTDQIAASLRSSRTYITSSPAGDQVGAHSSTSVV